MKMVADLFESVLDEYVPGFKRLSQIRCKTLIQSLYPVKPVYHDICICRQGCFLFGDETESTISPSNTIITGTAARRMKILSIGSQIASLIYHNSTRQMLLNNFHTPTDTYRDIFDGSIFSGMDSNPNDLYIGLYIDGFSKNNKKAQSLELIQLVVYNFSPQIRSKSDFTLKYVVLPGPRSPSNTHLYSFLNPLYDELKSLATTGITVTCEDKFQRTYKIHALVFTCDILAVTPLAGHLGHMSIRPCRICTTHYISPTTTIPKHLPTIPSIQMRAIEDFRLGDPATCLHPSDVANMIPGFSGPFFFGLDELHLIGMGLCKQLYLLFRDNYDGENEFKLSKSLTWWKQFEVDLEASRPTIPMSEFHGSFRVPWSKYSTRAVDWIDLVRYVFPALVVPSLPPVAASGVMAIIRFVQLTQRKQITSNDIRMMDEDLNTWNLFIEQMQLESVVARHFITPNHHYLLHVTSAIKNLGPMYSCSTRLMERSIGVLKKAIRSTTDSGANGVNVMVDMSALVYLQRQSKSLGYALDVVLNAVDDDMNATANLDDDDFDADLHGASFDDSDSDGDSDGGSGDDGCNDDSDDDCFKLGKSRTALDVTDQSQWPSMLQSAYANQFFLFKSAKNVSYSGTAYGYNTQFTRRLYTIVIQSRGAQHMIWKEREEEKRNKRAFMQI
ncbi:hypothetical protein [Absidia glauca]|uniref:Uncharacterized protein n=1 Tax=Absidia glauca TaxID=4829 RepID=A0A168P733_ABSGL|nr:hypothetical protein [Absidia glauca]